MPLNNEVINVSDRARGCILAGAIGDAMGGPFEGQTGPLQFREHTDWSISDDSQLTLATCESIIDTGIVSPESIAARMVHWFRARRITSMGASTLKALRDLDSGAHWALAGTKGEMSAGNGAAMRIAPLAFLLDPELSEHRQMIRDVCRITHHNEEAYVGALAIVTAIRLITFKRSPPNGLIGDVIEYLPDSRVRDRLAELPDDLTVAEVAMKFGSSGYVVDSVPLALYAASSIADLTLRSVLQGSIEAGGDTDTIASMAGQIAGAWIGASQIPRDMIEPLPNASEIVRIANEFAGALEALAER
jgi:ADP-ribosylglycohydrolase